MNAEHEPRDDAFDPARGLITAVALCIPFWIAVTLAYLRWWA